MNIKMPPTALSGQFRMVVSEDAEGERVKHDTGFFDNLITDVGMNRVGEVTTNSTTALASFTALCGRFVVGSGSATPAFTDTALAAPVAFASANPVLEFESSSYTRGWYEITVRHQFGQGQAVGNLSEIGIQHTSASGPLWSRALILDGAGNPTTLTVLADDFLTCYYTLRIMIPQEDAVSTESVMPDDIDGVDIEYRDYLTGRAMTEPYRLPGDQGRRVEKIQAPGVTGRTQAWRIAARRRRMAAYRRTVYKGSTELAAMNSYYMDYVGLQDGIPEWGQSAFVIDHEGAVLTLSEDVLPVGGEPVVMLRRQDGTATPPIPATVSGRRVTLAAMPPDVAVSSDPNAPTVVYIGRRTQVVHEALMTEVRPSGEARVEFQAVNMDNRVYLEDDMGPDQVILTSGLYPIIFDDSLAPSAAAPGVSWGNPPMDSMTVSMVAPAVYRRAAVRYLTYDNAEPEALGVAMLAPSVQRIQQIIPTYHEYAAEPESLSVAMLTPAVFRKKVADRFEYTIPEESLAIAMLAPTVTRINT